MPEFVLFSVILLLVLVGYWSLVTLPRQRDFQKRQRYAQTLSAGDQVITFGGIIGKVVDLDVDRGIAHVEIADGVVVRLVTAAIERAYDPQELAENVQLGLKSDDVSNEKLQGS
jgi:preprotein translocase subunit YajC